MDCKHVRRFSTALAAILFGLFLVVPPAVAQTTTIKGRILYGTIKGDLGVYEPPPDGTVDCDPSLGRCGFLKEDDPIAHVWVQLNNGAVRRAHTITNANGEFTMSVTGTPTLTLVVKAKNDYVIVKKYKGTFGNLASDKALKTKYPLDIDYSSSTVDLGDLTVVSDKVDLWYRNNDKENPKNYISRAFYMTTAGHVAGSHVEDLLNTDLPNRVAVRMGIEGFAFYYQIADTIFLENTDAVTFWHEYGHYVEDKLGAFDLIPAYAADGEHSWCTEMTGSTLRDVCDALGVFPGWIPACDLLPDNEEPSLNWAWLEGFAYWLAKVNTIEMYGSNEAANNALSDEYAMEETSCDSTDSADWTDPRAVEAVVGHVLWDLIDAGQDDDNGSGIDEVAEASVKDVMAIFSQGVLGLDEFWDAWRTYHPGVVSDLYAAYAFNGVDIGNAEDLDNPQPVTLSSATHTVSSWTNDPLVGLTIKDGIEPTPPAFHDDVSGSYRYFAVVDTENDTAVVTTGVVSLHPDLQILTPPSTKLEQTYSLLLEHGDQQYIHVNSEDMAGNGGTATTHFGPLRIDLVDPYWTGPVTVTPYQSDPGVSTDDPTVVLGYPALIKWSSADDLSGVAEVRLSFEIENAGFSTELYTTTDPLGDYVWYVEDVPVTDEGQISVTVTDHAGNDIVWERSINVKAPFDGTPTMSLGSDAGACDDGRVISADLNHDKYDDVILVCRIGIGGHVFVFRGTPNLLWLWQDFAWLPADDLVAADLDLDGDLDVVTVSQNVLGGATQADILINDGTGNLNVGPSQPLGPMAYKTVRVVNLTAQKTPSLLVFGVNAAAGNTPMIRAFELVSGLPTIPTPGLDPVDGDWEAADLNSDGFVDLVALGVDALGNAGLTVFWGSDGPWSREDLESYVSVSDADVDVGDFDADGKLDIFVMFDGAGANRITKLIQQTAAGFTSFAAAGPLEALAEGRGTIVDVENDAAAEVVAMGTDTTGAIAGWYLRNNVFLGTFDESLPPLIVPFTDPDLAWGDFDGDGDLDLAQVGQDSIGGFWTAIFENLLGDYIEKNDQPPSATNLKATYDPVLQGYLFSWNAPGVEVDETPEAGFGYELRIGTTPNGGQILSWAHPAGPSQQGSGLQVFVRMPAGVYYYDVRTVDSGWQRSESSGIKMTAP